MSFEIVGIDLGGHTTRAAFLTPERKMPIILRNQLANESTATAVALVPGEARLYGDAAAMKQFTKPQATIPDLMPWIRKPDPRDVGDCENLAPEQPLAYFLRNIIQFAIPSRKDKNADVSSLTVALSVPSDSSDDYRERLSTAAAIAGVPFQNLVLVRECDAALAYLHHLTFNSLPSAADGGAEPSVVLIADVGRDSTTITVGRCSKEKVELLFVKSVANGSRAFDEAITNHVLQGLAKKHPQSNVRGHLKSVAKIQREAAKAKEMLSSVDTVNLQVECLVDDIDVHVAITREIVDKSDEIAHYREQLLGALREVLVAVPEVAAGAASGLLRVEAIGSGWRYPLVQTLLKETLSVAKVSVSLDGNMCIAEGTSIVALLQKKATAAKDVTASAEEGAAATTDATAPLLWDAVHNVELVNFNPLLIPEVAAEALGSLIAVETEWSIADERIHQRLAAMNSLDAFILQTLDAAAQSMSKEKQSAIRAALEPHEYYVRDECEGDETEKIVARLELVRDLVNASFPEVAAHYAAVEAERKKKDEELERLSKEQAEEKEYKSDPQRLRGAQQRREQGQTLFKQEHWGEAQTRFVQALSILGELYDTKDPETQTKKKEIQLSCYLNISACSIKLQKWNNALNNANNALDLSPGHAKALFRRGQALAGLNDFPAARKALEEASEKSGKDVAVVAELDAVIAREEAEKKKEKKMFAKMFA